jgi:hypothetical protein
MRREQNCAAEITLVRQIVRRGASAEKTFSVLEGQSVRDAQNAVTARPSRRPARSRVDRFGHSQSLVDAFDPSSNSINAALVR